VSVKDGTARSVVAEFTFDASKVAYVTKSTYGPFSVLSTVSGNRVSVAGISDTAVDISSKTKLATVVFSVNQNATGTITFNCTTANVDGRDVACVAGSLAIAIEVWQAYDKNGNGKVDTNELISGIQDWLSNKLSTVDLIRLYRSGCNPNQFFRLTKRIREIDETNRRIDTLFSKLFLILVFFSPLMHTLGDGFLVEW
jgi:hypothetical protein